MCTQCTLQLPETNTFYMQCILGVIIIIWLKKMTNIKLFYFLSPNVLLLFVFKIDSWNVLFFLRNSVLCIWLSNEGTKHQFHLSLNYWKCNFFWQHSNATRIIHSRVLSREHRAELEFRRGIAAINNNYTHSRRFPQNTSHLHVLFDALLISVCAHRSRSGEWPLLIIVRGVCKCDVLI